MIKQRLLLENAERKRLLKNAELKLLNEQIKRFEEKRQNAKEAMNLVRKEEENAKARRIANANTSHNPRNSNEKVSRKYSNQEIKILLGHYLTNSSENKLTNEELNKIKNLLKDSGFIQNKTTLNVLNVLKNKNIKNLNSIRKILQKETKNANNITSLISLISQHIN